MVVKSRGAATPKTKVLAIGLDAAEQDLILQWMDSGDLPALSRLRDRSVWGPMENEPGLYTGAVWPSIYTGVSAARHGLYYSRQIRSGTYRTYPFHPSDLNSPPFWEVLSDAGYRVAVIDVPHAPLSKELNGIQVADWGNHDFHFPSVACWPPELAQEITQRFGADEVGSCEAADRGSEEYWELRDKLIARVERKAELVEHLLAKGDWDLFLAVFADSHCAGHQLWHLHEAENAQLETPGRGDPVKDVYVALDRAVGRLLDQVDSDTTVILFTSHGMGMVHDGNSVLDEILTRLEGASANGAQKVLFPVRAAYRQILPAGLRRHLRTMAGRLFHAVAYVDDVSIARDRKARKCFLLPYNTNCSAIRVNLVGREPDGRVHPGADYDAFFEALAADLKEIVNLETGQPIIKEVLRTADHYAGEHLTDLPDIIVQYNRDARIRRVHSEKIGEVVAKSSTTRTGEHCPRGLFFAKGPNIRPNHLNQAISGMDLAPTIAATLGFRLPDVDGQPIAALPRNVYQENTAVT